MKNTTNPPPIDASLREALEYLDGALLALWEAQARARWRVLLQRFVRPLAFFTACVVILALTLLFTRLGWSARTCFSVAVLCYMVPLFASLWFFPGVPDLSMFWAEIHRADEVITQQPDRELWLWPQQHPRDLWEDQPHVSLHQLRGCVEDRKQQLQTTLSTLVVQAESVPPENTNETTIKI